MSGVGPAEPRKDPRVAETDAGVLAALAGFGPDGATLAQWREAAGRANDTFYKSRHRLVDAGKALYDTENARYIAAEPKVGPGPELVENGSNWPAVQKGNPVVPP